MYSLNGMIGNIGQNVLTGEAGNDTLDGGGGTDTLKGGSGNDVYLVDSFNDVVEDGVGGGKDTIRATVTYQLSEGQEIESLILDLERGHRRVRQRPGQSDHDGRHRPGDHVRQRRQRHAHRRRGQRRASRRQRQRCPFGRRRQRCPGRRGRRRYAERRRRQRHAGGRPRRRCPVRRGGRRCVRLFGLVRPGSVHAWQRQDHRLPERRRQDRPARSDHRFRHQRRRCVHGQLRDPEQGGRQHHRPVRSRWKRRWLGPRDAGDGDKRHGDGCGLHPGE